MIATGETAGYYADYGEHPVARLGRCLTEGFAYQGDPSPYRDGRKRGEPSAWLPPTAFISFLQNHDQIGNRAMGERLSALARPQVLKALAAILLLAPNPPMLFMGEEWGTTMPFLYFCDFHDALATAVRDGRRSEFARFPAFREEAARERIPDPNAESTFLASKLNWHDMETEPHRSHLAFCRTLLALRGREITPRLAALRGNPARLVHADDATLSIDWNLAGETLALAANLSNREAPAPAAHPPGRVVYSTGDDGEAHDRLPPWCVRWSLG